MTTHDLAFSPSADLFTELSRQLEAFGARGAAVELLSGSFDNVVYVHPAFGPDAAHPMSFTEELRAAPPVTLRQGSGTIGFRYGEPFSHIHASFVDRNGRTTGGHLLPGTMIGRSGLQVRLHALLDVEWDSADDAETGFPVFAPEKAAAVHSPAAGTPAPPADDVGDLVSAVIARIRPGEFLDEAVAQVAHRAGFSRARIVAGLGSTVGALLDQIDGDGGPPTTVVWPAVEFTHLSGIVATGGTRLIGEVVDVSGNVIAGTVRNGENPVAVTFELLMANDE